MNTFFKFAFLIVAIGALVILFFMYQKMDNSRYRVIHGDNMLIAVDTETGKVFYWGGEQGWFVIGADGGKSNVKNPFEN